MKNKTFMTLILIGLFSVAFGTLTGFVTQADITNYDPADDGSLETFNMEYSNLSLGVNYTLGKVEARFAGKMWYEPSECPIPLAWGEVTADFVVKVNGIEVDRESIIPACGKPFIDDVIYSYDVDESLLNFGNNSVEFLLDSPNGWGFADTFHYAWNVERY